MAIRNFWTFRNCKVAKGCIEFKWEPGMSTTQKTRSCINLHRAIQQYTGLSALDISTASPQPVGVKLSAFNLKLNGLPVEVLYQGSKVYSDGYVAHKLYTADSLTAKRLSKEYHGNVVGFDCFGTKYPTEPKSAFYDFIYLRAVRETFGNTVLTDATCFTDIQAKPELIACQARSFCEYKLMQLSGCLTCLDDFDKFVEWHASHVEIDYIIG